MASLNSFAVLEWIRKMQDEDHIDVLRELMRLIAQFMIDAEAAEKIGAERYERTESRVTQRNGSRSRTWDTRLGTVDLKIPKLRQGSFFPSLLEPRRRAEQALAAVIQEAYVKGVSTRKVDDLVRALGLEGISKSEVSRLCQQMDEVVQQFKERPLEHEYPYVWLDATFPKVREGGRVQSMALVIAIGVTDTGEREVLGFDVGTSEDGAFWTDFLRKLKARGLRGVRLVVSDAHAGLRQAIAEVLTGATWQRCKVHALRNVLSQVPKKEQAMVASILRTIFAQSSQEAAREQLRRVVAELKGRFPKAMDILSDAEDDVLAFMALPFEHWRQICSTNPLERLNREMRRRMDVVGIFPNRDAVLRLAGAILQEQHEEWLVARRYFSLESMAKLKPNKPQLAAAALLQK
ncbi:IS256 family transposase [Alicyclobacillus acidocaldarius]|uniref:Mutator family transposase n=1 Tax=Alicyclobacillus acidocaldarius (strain Tc-4-1) TaxID=1048834 RepID=F8IKW6_ALIAT|nr:IS256 family transposase [Alicyclobacillus acidocaldarius]AEJ44882.1 transposase mutator type [Alicyclobacillus acidocaldarius subsp. acidocaldarius Tc-4-1]